MSGESDPQSDVHMTDSSNDESRADPDGQKRGSTHPKIFAATLDLAKALEQRDAALKARRRGGGNMESSVDFVLPSPVQRSAQLLQLRQTAQAVANVGSKPPLFGGGGLSLPKASGGSEEIDTGSPPKSHRATYEDSGDNEGHDGESSDSSNSDSSSSSSSEEEDDHIIANFPDTDISSPRFKLAQPPAGWRPASPQLQQRPQLRNSGEKLPPREDKDQVDFSSMPVADALGWFSTNPEFVEMVERNDARLMRYIRDKQNVVQLLECINNPTPTDEYKHRADAIPALAVFILTAPTNASFLREIVSTPSMMDVFFESTLKALTLRPEWSRILTFMLRGADAGPLQAYLGAVDSSKLEGVPRGSFIFKKLFDSGYVRFEHLTRALFTLVNPEETVVPWGELLAQVGFVEHLAARLLAISASADTWTYETQIEASYLADIVRLALAKCAPLASRLHDRAFASVLVRILAAPVAPSTSHTPHPIADVCIDVINFMIEVAANSGTFGRSNIPPLVQALSTPLIGMADTVPIKSLKAYLERPTLQRLAGSFGLFRMKILRCIHLLLQGDFPEMHNLLFTEGIFTACLDVMFMYKSANTLHNAVKELLNDLLYCENLEAIANWVVQSRLLDKIVDGVQPPAGDGSSRFAASSTTSQFAGSVDSDPHATNFFSHYVATVSYIPHLLQLSEKLNQTAALNANISVVLKEHPRWDTFFTSMEPRIQALYEELGDVTALRSSHSMAFGSLVA